MHAKSLALAALLFVVFSTGIIRSAKAAEPMPGDACPVLNRIVTSGGPETTGVRRVMRCNGSIWQQESTIDATGNTGIGTDSPVARLHVGGEVIIGPTTGIACSSTVTGGLRWSSANLTFEMCDGTNWKQIIATGGTGTPSTPNSGTGYFVLSNGTWDGALGNFVGANAKCLSDLQTNNWLNKSDASSRGLLNASHVQAWLCDISTCQEALSGTTYTFAASGQSSTGGATMTADASGYIPGNSQNWSGANYFGSGYSYWTGRAAGTSTLANGGAQNSAGVVCGSYGAGWQHNSASGGDGGGTIGNANNTGNGRWSSTTPVCSTAEHLLCMVHPGNESSQTAGYFVLTATTWNGNLGGRSGADAKCLTELSTTHTDWRGYSTANANGQLVASKVKAFLCDTAACTNLMANQTYNFAKAGDSSAGGASFTTDSSGLGPNDSSNWSGASYFSGTYDYWAERYYASATQWNSAGAGVGYCSTWGSSSSGQTADIGNSAQTGFERWHQTPATCDQTKRLICFVNP